MSSTDEIHSNSLRQWGQLIGASTGASVVVFIPSALSTILLYRLLSPTDAGQYSLVQALSETLVFLTSFGQPGMFARVYSRSPRGTFDWRKDMLWTVSISLPFMVAGLVIMGQIYDLGRLGLLLLLPLALFQLVLVLMAVIAGTQQNYVFGNIAQRLPQALLLGGMLLFMIGFADANFNNTILLWLMMLVIVTGYSLFHFRKHIPIGEQTLTTNERIDGLIFVVAAGVSLMSFQGIIAIAGISLSLDALAIYGAAAIVFRGYNLLNNVLGRIFVTELVRNAEKKIIRLILWLWGGAGIVGASALVVMPSFIEIVYSGKYDASKPLIPLLVVVGTLMLTETLPRSFITGKSSGQMLNRFIWLQAIILIVSGGIALYLIPILGLIGLPIAQIIVLSFRNIIAYGTMVIDLRK